jgi:hypothetical protein
MVTGVPGSNGILARHAVGEANKHIVGFVTILNQPMGAKTVAIQTLNMKCRIAIKRPVLLEVFNLFYYVFI